MIKKIVVLSLVIFLLSTHAYAKGNHKFTCLQSKKDIKGLAFLSIHNRYPDMMFYDLPDDTIAIAQIDFSQIAYIFWKNQYVGYAVYINDKNERKRVKQFLYKKHNAPSEGNQQYRTWYTEDQIIIFTSFSLHQARVLFLCKNTGTKMKKIIDAMKVGIGPHY